jgi:SAM-dependent MidA family methyltransferase
MNNDYVKVEQIKPAEIQKHQEEECIIGNEFYDLFDEDPFKDIKEKWDEEYKKRAEEMEAVLKKNKKLGWYASQLTKHIAKHQPK